MVPLLTYPHDRGPFRWWLRIEELDGTINVCKSKTDWKRLCAEHVSVLQATAIYPDHRGTAVWIRPCLSRAVLAKSMREQHGIRTVAEVDDNYMSDPKLNLSLRITWTDDHREHHMKAICSMDAIVFSTDLLRDMYAKQVGKWYKQWFGRRAWQAEKPELHVCGNHVPTDDWPARVEHDGPVRVGWMGSPSHVWDVDLAWAAMLYAKQNGAETWMVGYDPSGDGNLSITVDGFDRSPRSQFKVEQWKKVGFNHVPWREPAKYERLALPFDIGLCPLLTNQSTLGKSDVKFIEYTISGAATVAWNNPVYSRTIVHGETGLLVGSPGEMIDAVALLMNNPKLRRTLVENAQQYVREERGEKQLREEWTAAIND